MQKPHSPRNLISFFEDRNIMVILTVFLLKHPAISVRNLSFLSFSAAKRKKQRKPTTKTNLKFCFARKNAHAISPQNLRFALFVDSSRTTIHSEDAIKRIAWYISVCAANNFPLM
ncbi:MAG: hypothetical protein H0W84_06605 [Bacteroidetes bacterium]|nr:hypothetical protein [Bacteroidota bacterium]